MKYLTKTVSFNLAKLLKEKGFKEEVTEFYFENGEPGLVKCEAGYEGGAFDVTHVLSNINRPGIYIRMVCHTTRPTKDRYYQEVFSAPTIAQVIDWLFFITHNQGKLFDLFLDGSVAISDLEHTLETYINSLK